MINLRVRRHVGIVFLLTGLIGGLSSCQEVWNEHFSPKNEAESNSLYELVGEDAQLSIFKKMIDAVGGDTLLSSTQTYTVWAPVNDALAKVDLSNEEEVRRIVYNHIARYASPSSTEPSKQIYMLNGKAMSFTSNDSFNGVALQSKDHRAKNGILHKVQDCITYKYNLLEYLSSHEQYSAVFDFMDAFTVLKYDEELSTAYDSVFKKYNPLMQDPRYGIGSLGNEDSVYTMIIPDNTAWEEAMTEIAPYFKPQSNSTDSVQRIQTGLAILNGLTFRGRLDSFATLDSIRTVTANVIFGVKDYLLGYEKVEASNGVIYLANSHLNRNDTCVWNHPIVLETEGVDNRTLLAGTVAYIRNTDINSFVKGVSRSSYLEVSSSSSEAGVTFSIPNTLAGKYDIYVDFVSPRVDGLKLASEMTRVQFVLKYAGGPSRGTTNKETSLLVGGEDAADIITLKAWEGVELVQSNFYDGMWLVDENNSLADVENTTTLQVKTNVKSTELNKTLVRKFRIDCIRFVPVM